ncbi:MAG TPA: preprotein translocase subunit SecG [Candidatus Avidehalobacter gallistercoris]|uniref:Protein-export membrane protein SecG n=1 Tax=Candidatus Avidehalobacter gallistercoris TaxID=2840694 RepID=A0A9D1KZI7_9FIRM|nr:preprotein translocase subunit SecG [Candidatus Avidehalobacter gallistercoris]
MTTVLMILQMLCAIALIVTVLMQSSKSAGLSGSIAGGAETFFGKKKGMDELFSKLSIVAAVLFLALTLLLAAL